ncbi:MAG: nucleotidyltransferase substrate binding protein [Rhodobacteraceae bacterium]|nr:nucleotidyltransferase substrate binding protein [Gammaproteobacteria bacterium]MCY4326607.1 nucleotidyltransferase substrate binding protein [Paracoccaceae bacterium]
MTEQPPRWHYRFDIYRRAYTLLYEAMEQSQSLTQLEKEGVVRRFKYTMELAWNTLKDYLEAENVVFEQITPRAVIRKAFEAQVIRQGDVWQDALDARNKISHTYDFKDFERVVEAIEQHYLSAFGELYEYLMKLRLTYR